MAEMGVYKLDTGQNFPSNCFPIRSFFHRSKEGAGHWLVAHRRQEEERYRRTREQKTAEQLYSGPSAGSEPLSETVKCASDPLNAQLLMTLHYVDKPSELCSVNISERNLHLVEPEGLEEFDSVAFINASDNRLTLEAFSRFPALRELELSLNDLYTLEVHVEDFPRLEVLDLSYNNLSADGILAVGLLPRLKMLHLTGNNLQMLPPNMSGPYYPPDKRAPQCRSLFQSLEVLMLDDNKLSSPGVFISLGNLRSLQHLNLEGNDISEVPYLEQNPPIQPADASDRETGEDAEDGIIPQCSSDPPMDQEEFINKAADEDKEARPYSRDFGTQFPQLRHLNLAGNKIAEEEALLAVALFPELRELVIHSNPLTTQRSGDPPVLTYFLQDRLGIMIRRKKNTDAKKAHIMLPLNFKRKVKSKIPEVPKHPLITSALSVSENPHTERRNKNSNPLPSENKSTDVLLPSFSQTSSEEWEEHRAVASGSEILEDTEDTELPSEALEAEQPFFVTEIDLLEHEYQERTPETVETAEILRKDTKNCAEKLTGYEIFQDDDLHHFDFDIPDPVGIQHTVRALEHTLRNLLVYRDPKANLDQLQRPYKEQQKRIRNLPSVKPSKPKEEKVKEILTKMKEMRTISEVPLGEVMRRKDVHRKEYEEALTLLKDVKEKYKTVHLNAVKHAAQIERDVRHENGT
ncbi:X-ray radiation resistance-associated protein 1 isoform X1 [Astyanax mexicanus]|uniref:X-ray radiation resistance-associated protein 1 isoform X1 n=1 Tax=Astyanax mexicanus TaxID=7994 RepID=A0A8T2L102_ASTMX|nr:X-ray radiation resistance-associated protein 1 isoform X1 [Astyanax mexicanus]